MSNVSVQDRTSSPSIVALPVHDSEEHNSMAPYNELRRLMTKNRLFDRQPAYFACKISVNTMLWTIGLALLVMVHGIWLPLVVACYLAFVSTQIGFLVHDAGHLHISKVRWKNTLIGLIYTNLVLGMKPSAGHQT